MNMLIAVAVWTLISLSVISLLVALFGNPSRARTLRGLLVCIISVVSCIALVIATDYGEDGRQERATKYAEQIRTVLSGGEMRVSPFGNDFFTIVNFAEQAGLITREEALRARTVEIVTTVRLPLPQIAPEQ